MHGGAVTSTVTSQQEGSGFKPPGQLGPFCVYMCSLCVRGFSQSNDRQVRLNGGECEREWFVSICCDPLRISGMDNLDDFSIDYHFCY